MKIITPRQIRRDKVGETSNEVISRPIRARFLGDLST